MGHLQMMRCRSLIITILGATFGAVVGAISMGFAGAFVGGTIVAIIYAAGGAFIGALGGGFGGASFGDDIGAGAHYFLPSPRGDTKYKYCANRKSPK